MLAKRARTIQSESQSVLSNTTTYVPDGQGDVNHTRYGGRYVRKAPRPNATSIANLCYDLINPPVTFKKTWDTDQISWASNREQFLEFAFLTRSDHLTFVNKCMVDANNLSPRVLPDVIGNTPQSNFKTRFEGGLSRMTFTNLSNITQHLELREYKIKKAYHGQGLAQPPCFYWHVDDNDSYLNGQGLPTTNANPQPTAQLQVPDMRLIKTATGQTGRGTVSIYERPNRSSPQLHRFYDLGPKFIVNLEPGQSYCHTISIQPFWDSPLTMPDQYDAYQFYTHFLWVFARGQVVADNSVGSTKMTISGGELGFMRTDTLYYRAIFPNKTSNVVEFTTIDQTGGATGTGPFYTIAEANEGFINVDDNAETKYDEI